MDEKELALSDEFAFDGVINDIISSVTRLVDKHALKERRLVYPLTRGFGYDDDPPPLSLVDVGPQHEVYDSGASGEGPFEAVAVMNEEAES